MKQSMQIVALVAFLGCFAILAIAAGSGKSRSQEDCHEEWNKGVVPEIKEAEQTDKHKNVKELAQCIGTIPEDLNFPVAVLRKML